MKKVNLLYLLILPFVFASCDFLDKFDHFSAGNTFEQSFNIDVVPGISDSYSESVVFAVTDDATISDNIGDIETFDVNDISYKITDFKGDASATADGNISITAAGRILGDPVSISGLNFSDLYDSGEDMSLPLTNATITAIQDAYLNGDELTITAEGSYLVEETTHVEFTIYMSIEAKIKMAN